MYYSLTKAEITSISFRVTLYPFPSRCPSNCRFLEMKNKFDNDDLDSDGDSDGDGKEGSDYFTMTTTLDHSKAEWRGRRVFYS